MLGAALDIVARGWPVIPLAPGGKAPIARLVPNGVAHATCDPEVIAYWWQRERGANIGIACRHIFVVDVDPRNDGDRNLEALLSMHEPFPPTLAQRTGSGIHYLFKVPGLSLRGKLATGIDLVHGPRRYIVAAPSIHPSGRKYGWLTPLSTPLAELPEWLVTSALQRGARPVRANARQEFELSKLVARAQAYARKIPPAVAGQGGHAHTFLTASRLVRGFSLKLDEAYAVMSEWNRTCQPPWSESELRRKIDQALRHGRMPFGALLEERIR